jgi:hypothetical protein
MDVHAASMVVVRMMDGAEPVISDQWSVGRLTQVVTSRSLLRGGALPTQPPPCLSIHLGIIGGAEAAFWRLAAIIFAPRQTCTNFRSSAEGREGSGPARIPMMLRVIWTGVRISPQGKPHQPNPREKSTPPSWLLTAQERQQTLLTPSYFSVRQ